MAIAAGGSRWSRSCAVCIAWALLLCWAGSSDAFQIRGKVATTVDNLSYIALKPGSAIRLLLWTSKGDELETFADKDGWFTFRDVPPGTHLLTPQNPKFVFPEVRVEVTPKSGFVRAAYAHNSLQMLNNPFIIRPLALAQYYELRKPLDVWSFVKSPYGLMIGFMLFGIFVFPMLKVDPEEYQEAMASLRGQEGQPPQQGAQQQRIRDR